ncbi:hypothetical protein J2W47_005531 [Priestia megaterium]|jgi:hypothetical protein|nr:hypothetical protein [Priestia megaterium]
MTKHFNYMDKLFRNLYILKNYSNKLCIIEENTDV